MDESATAFAFGSRFFAFVALAGDGADERPNLRSSVLGVVGQELYFVGGMPVNDTDIYAAWRHVGVFDLDSGSWQIRSELDVSVNLNSQYGFWYSFDVTVVK